MLEEKIVPSEEPMKLSDQERRAFEMVYNTTSSVTQMASGLVDKAVSSAVSGINSMVYNDNEMKTREPVENATRHFGISALQAAVKIVGGVASAASAVLGSSRDSLIQVVHKKYGQDAGYIAQRTIGTGANIVDMLVYFDARGISRRVVVSGANGFSGKNKSEDIPVGVASGSSVVPEQTKGNQVVFENDWLEDQFNQGKEASASTKKDDKVTLTI